MAKFNKTTTQKENDLKTRNIAGGISYKYENFKEEVTSLILNSLLSGDNYYEAEKDSIKRIVTKIEENIEYAEFLAKSMVYARTSGKLRSISHIVGEILLSNVKGKEYLRKALYKSLIRPDDATELVSLWNTNHKGKMIPNALKKVIKDSLENKWDSYQLKKYFGKKKSVKVSDLIKLSHPKPKTDVQKTMFKQALEGKLPNINTAQTVNARTTGMKRVLSYEKMLDEKKLGYMALLKNLKNILIALYEEELSDDMKNRVIKISLYEKELNDEIKDRMINKMIVLLENEKACLNSNVLPFRFKQSHNMVKSLLIDDFKLQKILKAIETGFVISARNISIANPGEKIALLLDDSYSMTDEHGGEAPFDIGITLMAGMLTGLKDNEVTGYLWANRAKKVSVSGSPFEFMNRTQPGGGGTDVWAPIKLLIESNTYVDKIIIFTDMQMYSVSQYGYGEQEREFKDMVKEYRKINSNVKVLFWNLANYGGGVPMKLSHDIMEVSGYSDTMLEVVSKIWNDPKALIKEIESVEL